MRTIIRTIVLLGFLTLGYMVLGSGILPFDTPVEPFATNTAASCRGGFGSAFDRGPSAVVDLVGCQFRANDGVLNATFFYLATFVVGGLVVMTRGHSKRTN